MSRVIYTDMTATGGQDALRTAHGVRIVTEAEEGTGVNALPAGVYGFTYSPALPNAPLFAVARYRSYETHKLSDGEVFVIGFATPADVARLQSGDGEQTILIQPYPEDGSNTLVKIPYSRIRQHRQYAAPNQHGFTVTIAAALASVG